MYLDKVVVVDVATSLGSNNLLFKREAAGNARHGWAMCYLYEECLKRRIQLLTTDLYFSLRPKIKKAILWRNATINSSADAVIGAGAYPAIIMGFEYPLYACDFYWNLKRYTAPYDYTLMPKGAKPFVSPKTKFRTFISPQPYPLGSRVESNFKNRKFLTMISSNSRIHPLRRLYVTVANFIKPLPTLVNRELYLDRLEALCHFAKNPDFDFYGYGWDKPARLFIWEPNKKQIREAVSRTWRGSPDDKFPVLQQYKFSICFENAIFSGWITEKIIDSLLAGCIPIYFGAPDVTDFIPEGTFIDFRKFKNYTDLDYYLRNIDEKTYNQYIERINLFVSSNAFYLFTQEKFAAEMIELFESYF